MCHVKLTQSDGLEPMSCDACASWYSYTLHHKLIMVIELSGVQFGLKSYA